MRKIDDKLFLTEVIAELDDGWVQFKLCDVTGQKCLVGAGMSVLGYRFGEESPNVLSSEYLEWSQNRAQYEVESEARLSNLLSDELRRIEADWKSSYEDEEDFDSLGPIDLNDTYVNSYSELREILVRTRDGLVG